MKKNSAAVALGRLGGKKAAETMTPEERRKRAQKAGNANAKRISIQKTKAPKS